MAKKNTRKCKVCGEQFDIYINDYVKFKGGFVEIECYKSYKKGKGNLDEIIELELKELLDISREEKRLRLEKEKEDIKKKANAKKREINRKDNLGKLIKYFTEVYGIEVYPKSFYTKLAQINNGTFKNVSTGIPYDDLLDMFKRKKGYLDKVAFNQSRLGKEMTNIQRLNYDIAIMINKYDEYISWKNSQKVLEAETKKEQEVEENKIKVDYKKIKVENDNNDDSDIFDIVNDIY